MSKFSLQNEMKLLATIAAPIVLMQVLAKLIFLEFFTLVGSLLDAHSINALSLSIDITNLTGCSFLFGSLTGIETLAPQALGAKRYRRLGVIVKQAIFTLLIIFIPVSIFWISCASMILEFLQEPREPSRLASSAMVWLVLIYFFWFGFQFLSRFLWVQQNVLPLMYVSLVGCIVHPIILYFIIPYLKFYSWCVAFLFTSALMFILILSYTVLKKPYPEGTFDDCSWERSLRWEDYKRYLNLAIAGIFSMVEWWVWEVMCLMCGWIGPEALGAHTPLYAIASFLWMLPFGLGIGLQTRIGFLIGEGRVQDAKLLCKATQFIGAAIVLFDASVYWMLRDVFISWYCPSPEIKVVARDVWNFGSIFIVLDGFWAFERGIMTGLGQQAKQSVIMIFSLVVIMMPLMYYTVHQGGDLVAVYQVLDLGYCVFCSSLFFYYTFICDWQKVSDDIHERLMRENSETAKIL